MPANTQATWCCYLAGWWSFTILITIYFLTPTTTLLYYEVTLHSCHVIFPRDLIKLFYRLPPCITQPLLIPCLQYSCKKKNRSFTILITIYSLTPTTTFLCFVVTLHSRPVIFPLWPHQALLLLATMYYTSPSHPLSYNNHVKRWVIWR